MLVYGVQGGEIKKFKEIVKKHSQFIGYPFKMLGCGAPKSVVVEPNRHEGVFIAPGGQQANNAEEEKIETNVNGKKRFFIKLLFF